MVLNMYCKLIRTVLVKTPELKPISILCARYEGMYPLN